MSGRTARRRVTMTEVARAAGVSVMTVSYAYGRPDRVSDETRAKVREAAERLGYPGPHPGARSLRRGRTGNLGVVLGEHLTYAFDDPQASRFLAGVAQVCADHGMALTLVPVTGGPADVDRVTEAAVDAFVVWTTADDDPVIDAIAATGLPATVHGGPRRDGLAFVAADDRAAARAAGGEVFAGARRPAVLSFPLDRARVSTVTFGAPAPRPGASDSAGAARDENATGSGGAIPKSARLSVLGAGVRGPVSGIDPETATFRVTRQRLRGFRDAWSEIGGDWPEVRVAVCSTNSAREAEELAAELLTGPHACDAVAAMSDELALGTLRAAARLGLAAPADFTLSGWDDTDAAAPAGLTTIAQSLRDQGARCARAALGHPAPGDRDTEVAWHLVRRDSTRRRR
ncbi:DNA-binding LacI/PurR family transcriptional regulator [Streptosporangium becharense]|uniref:DNA-binding LacI/PurR family transcriptional regulator n=1 Tax=Streptosporangium becharense TaxID=1816182 RepID=A0A7W9IEP3_9ACTN|nr:substrate-binding domain-containing protein [Streptosporangium becharense]MBB2910099.1 DNA-binding LacI/PurR family transcriptional regulator [Streptosporangium becharense]MBB5818946.1 DNA-binding LacI/PurR family transcriptional regulator [Streptosporangium becharense]